MEAREAVQLSLQSQWRNFVPMRMLTPRKARDALVGWLYHLDIEHHSADLRTSTDRGRTSSISPCLLLLPENR